MESGSETSHRIEQDAGDGRSPVGGSFPPDDADRSAFTGWTREHWAWAADLWLDQIRPYDSPAGALPRLPGHVTGDGARREGMETVARSFLLAAARMTGARRDGDDRCADDLAERYARALLAGTRPGGDEAWPMGVGCRPPLTGITQSIVEAANIAFGLHVSREVLWDGLTRLEQRQLASWLRHHARIQVWQNNWQLFPAMAEGFLRSVGEDTSGCTGDRNVARVESWYLGSGWYTDGAEHSIDYYSAWVIHPMLWAWYRMTDRVGTPEGQRHLERLAAFVSSSARMVAPDGSVLHVGRSLTYRTAVLAALWCAEIAGANPLSPGTTRRLASGVLRRFVDKGVGTAGPLSLGWYQPFAPVAQSYSGFGSPYFAGIGFLGLALPGTSPVWTAPEEAQPTDHALGDAIPIPEAGWIVSAGPDGISRLINHGSDHCTLPTGDGADPDDPHYAKFAYSTHTAPGTLAAWEDDVDGHFALIAADGRASRRCALRGSRVEGRLAGSVHLPQLDGKVAPDTAVTTVSAVNGIFEVRAHLLAGVRPWRVREGGYAVAGDTVVSTGIFTHGAWVRGDEGVTAAVIGLRGLDGPRVHNYVGVNALGRYSSVPSLCGTAGSAQSVFVSLHVLTRGAEPDPDAWSDAVRVAVDGTAVTVFWADGRVDSFDLDGFVPWDHHTMPEGGRRAAVDARD